MSDPRPSGPNNAYLPLIEGNNASGAEGPPPWKPTETPVPTATPTEPAPASQRIAIDPITRIEGHLRLEVQIDNGRVTDAWSAGMMFRGIELLLPGRDPRDAWVFAQRICGV